MSPIEPQQNRRPGQLSLVEPAPEQSPEQMAARSRQVDPATAPLQPRRSDAPPRYRRRLHWGRWAALLVLLCVAAAYGYWTLLPPAVAVVEPHRGPAVQAVYATGTVEPSVMIPISPRSMAPSGRAEDRRRQRRPKGSAAGPPRKRRFAARDLQPPQPRSGTPNRSSIVRRSLSNAGSRRAAPMIGPGRLGEGEGVCASAPRRRRTISISSPPPPARSSAATARSAR